MADPTTFDINQTIDELGDYFRHLHITDVIDFVLVGLLIYSFFRLIRGTPAVNIFIGILGIFLLWKIVEYSELFLLSEILGQFISLGLIVLIIVFQPEIREFLLMLGRPHMFGKVRSSRRLFGWTLRAGMKKEDIDSIVTACANMSNTKTGVLIVIARSSELKSYIESGIEFSSTIRSHLLESIFYKNSTLHDGATIIRNGKIESARSILPVSDNPNLPVSIGLRHRAAIGITEKTDAISVIVSEQTGAISAAMNGNFRYNIGKEKLREFLMKELS
ncbi:MAG: diadenylate cyclase CdaA [Bacteroidota bacterium]